MDLRVPLLALVSIATFLLAAKSHGRQVRLERERAGFHSVVFGGSNPAFVEQVWRKDRWRYWPTFGLTAVAVLLLRWRGFGGEGFGSTAFALWFFPFATAFCVAGLWSLADFAGTRAENPAFTDAALKLSAMLWPGVFVGYAVVARLFWSRASPSTASC
jgi:hypothetical protein